MWITCRSVPAVSHHGRFRRPRRVKHLRFWGYAMLGGINNSNQNTYMLPSVGNDRTIRKYGVISQYGKEIEIIDPPWGDFFPFAGALYADGNYYYILWRGYYNEALDHYMTKIVAATGEVVSTNQYDYHIYSRSVYSVYGGKLASAGYSDYKLQLVFRDLENGTILSTVDYDITPCIYDGVRDSMCVGDGAGNYWLFWRYIEGQIWIPETGWNGGNKWARATSDGWTVEPSDASGSYMLNNPIGGCVTSTHAVIIGTMIVPGPNAFLFMCFDKSANTFSYDYRTSDIIGFGSIVSFSTHPSFFFWGVTTYGTGIHKYTPGNLVLSLFKADYSLLGPYGLIDEVPHAWCYDNNAAIPADVKLINLNTAEIINIP